MQYWLEYKQIKNIFLINDAKYAIIPYCANRKTGVLSWQNIMKEQL